MQSQLIYAHISEPLFSVNDKQRTLKILLKILGNNVIIDCIPTNFDFWIII